MRNKGITLVALVITVIILLILAGVAISMITGVDGLIGRANQSAELYNNAALNEAERLNALLNGEYSNNTDENGDNEQPPEEEDKETKANPPEIEGTGLIPVIINENGTHKELTVEQAKSTKWYDYSEESRQWANAVTKNNKGEVTGYFVWIPRYEYQISGETIHVNFVPTEKTTATAGYIIHPAFTNESSTGTGTYRNYQNGGWDDEISGFWVAKFEAGYAGGNNTVTAVDSRIKHTGETASTNYYGNIATGSTAIKYPVFLPKTYAYNNINIGDMYNISREIENESSYYGLTNVDSHMMKNSEWGAVAYLTQSKYGRNGTEVTINNVNFNGQNSSTIYGITGYAGHEISATYNTLTSTTLGNEVKGSSLTSYGWNTEKGVLGSSTGNVYGVYDLSGSLWEYTAGYVPVQDSNYKYINKYGGTFSKRSDDNIITESTKYASVYAYSGSGSDRSLNYSQTPNPSRRGEAIWETSTNGNSANGGWNGDRSHFVYSTYPFTMRGGDSDNTDYAGAFSFHNTSGDAGYIYGFRVGLLSVYR